MKQILMVVALSVNVFAYGQNDIPFKDGLVFYEATDSASGSNGALFVKSNEWLSKVFKTARYVTESQDKDLGVILAKGNGDIVSKGLAYSPNSKFAIKINVKDGKYRIQVYDISITHTGMYRPIEWFISKYGDKKASKPFLDTFDSHYKELVQSYIDFMKTKDDF